MHNYIKHIVGAIGGQGFFLLGSMLYFLLAAKTFTVPVFAAWGVYQMLIAMVEGVRQGLLQNGMTRLIIQYPDKESRILGTVLLIHLIFISFAAGLFYIFSGWLADFWDMPELAEVLRFAFWSFLGLGSMQLFYHLIFTKGKNHIYFFATATYLAVSASGLVFLFWTGHVDVLSMLLLQSLAAGSILVWVFSLQDEIELGFPSWFWGKKLLSFGKHAAMSNAFSQLFQKADIFMIGFFLEPEAVGIFLVASKVMQYVELPISALSQMLYPKIAAACRPDASSDLNFEYSRAILTLFVMLIPGALFVLVFTEQSVMWLSDSSFIEAVPLIIFLTLAALTKPWGRVFGMTLDALGKPEINLRMLTFSLGINLGMNAFLIPFWGLEGAALATASSVILTIMIGQWKLKKYLQLAPFGERWRMVKKNMLKSQKNRNHEFNLR